MKPKIQRPPLEKQIIYFKYLLFMFKFIMKCRMQFYSVTIR